MALTRRARRRLSLLLVGSVVVVGIGVGLWFLQQSIKDSRADEARASGIAAAEAGEWEEALPLLSLAVARDQTDIEAVMMLAEARSRVPEDNDRHLNTAMGYFTRATTLADRQGVDEEVLMSALRGRARMELANNAIARVEDTALEILALEPSDDVSLTYLMEIRKSRGDNIADDIGLVVRGDRSDQAWLLAHREAEDDDSMVALRWALERLVLEPEEPEHREAVLDILRQGGSVDRQLLAGIPDIESPLDVAEAWIEEAGPDTAMPLLILAREHLREGTGDEEATAAAREALDRAESTGLDDPSSILRAMLLRENLGTREDRTRADGLLAEAEARVESEPTLAAGVAIRHWNAGRSDAAMRVLDRAFEAADGMTNSELLDLAANASLVAMIERRENRGDYLERMEAGLSAVDLDLKQRDLFNQLMALLRAADVEIPSNEELQRARTSAALIPGNPLVQTLHGDVLARAGYRSMANTVWVRAGEIDAQRSLPIGRRVVRGLLATDNPTEAFRQAAFYAGGTGTVAAAISLCEAWLAIDAVGIDATEVLPGFELAATPLEFLLRLESDLEGTGAEPLVLAPMIVESAMREGRGEIADEVIERAIAKPASTAILFRLAAFSRSNDLGREQAILQRIREAADSETSLDRVAVLEAELVREQGDPDAALAIIEERFDGRSEDAALIALASERLAHAEATEAGTDAIEKEARGLLALPLESRLIRRIQGIGIREDIPELSIAVIDRAGERFGPDAAVTVLSEAEHVLAFELTDVDSVRKAILRADPVVASGSGDGDLEMALARLLQAAEPPQTSRAIDVLSRCVAERPGRFDAAVLLVDLLQRDGRFDDANDQMGRLYRRRESAPPAVQRLIPTLLAGQGDAGMVASSACELAERTGRPLDRLECVRARYRAGDEATGDAMLDELLASADRPFAVDIEAASREVRRGNPEAAVDLLEASTVFPSDLRRSIAVASLLLRLEDWSRLEGALDGTGTEGEGSGEIQVLRALLSMNRPEADVEAARTALDRAVELSPADVGVLRRNATIRLSNPQLRDSAAEAIDLFGEVRKEESALMRLALDASPDGKGFRPNDAHLGRAMAIIDLLPTTRAAWSLAVDLFGAASEQALARGDLSAATRHSDSLVEVCERAVSRFPGDQAFPAQLSQIHLVLGNYDDALAAAIESLRRAGESPVLGSVIQIAFVQGRLDRWDAVVDTLAPFQEEILAGADNRPRAWGLLMNGLMRTGRVDDAWRVFQARSRSASQAGILDWLVALEGAPPSAALVAADLAVQAMPRVDSRLPLVGALAAVHRRTGDSSVRTRMEAILDEMAAEATSPGMPLRLQVTRIGFDAQNDVLGTLRRYGELIDELPPGTIDRIVRFESLSEAERDLVRPIANVTIMAMNNFAAMSASAVLDGEVPFDDVPSLLERAGEFADTLGRIDSSNPEILDTRAMVALALEDGARAVDLETQALQADPRRWSFRFNLARGLQAMGRVGEARLQAREAVRQLRRQPQPDEDQIERIEQFITELPG